MVDLSQVFAASIVLLSADVTKFKFDDVQVSTVLDGL